MVTFNRWTTPENEERLRKAVANNKSVRQVLLELDLIPAGGNYHNIKFHIVRLGLSTDHFLGNRVQVERYTKPKHSGERLTWKRYLIHKFGHQCQNCHTAVWQGQTIALELEHINGDSTDNREENLLLLCPNCHAQTPTYRRRKQQR